jgi:hypothetical protein
MTKRQAEEETRKKLEQAIHPTVSITSDLSITASTVRLTALYRLREEQRSGLHGSGRIFVQCLLEDEKELQ